MFPRYCRRIFSAEAVHPYFALVDLFLAPSHFLIERFVDWGLPRARIQYEDYGRRAFSPVGQWSVHDGTVLAFLAS